MKRILLLSTKNYLYLPKFVDAASQNGIELVCKLFSEMIVQYNTGLPLVFFEEEALSSFDLVYVRNSGQNIEQQALLAFVCAHLGITLIDQARIGSSSWIDRKTYEYASLSKSKLPIIPSIFVSRAFISEKLVDKVGYPLVAKVSNLDQGKGVFLCHNYRELTSLFQNHEWLLIQSFIPNHGDKRLLVIGDKVVAAMRRESANKDEFRNNASLGGRTQAMEPTDNEKTLAILAAKALKYQIAGVDLVLDEKTGKNLIMEVNLSPQFEALMLVTGINIPEKIVEFLVSKIK